MPASLASNRRLDRWVRLLPDGTVAVRTGKVELGQGITSALAQIAAEELDVSYGRIRMIPADTGESPDEGITAGSVSVEQSGSALRQACAEIRHELLEAAADLLDVHPQDLEIEDGTVIAPTGKTVTYWDLAGKANLLRDADGRAKPKAAHALRIVGRSLPRLDFASKISGAAFIHDLELPGMLHGRVVRPPSYRAKLLSLDAEPVRAMPGVETVVQDGRFLGVVARREEQAIQAMQAFAKRARWEERADLPDVHGVPAFLCAAPAEREVLRVEGIRPATAPTLSAFYSRPYLFHGSIGPACAVAWWREDGLEVWSHSQSIRPLRRDLAIALRIAEEAIMVHHAEGAGCYGHNGADDAALDAALLARAVPGRPVRVQWMREDEFGWEPLGPAMATKLEGWLDGEGRIASWRSELWSNRHIMRPGRDANPNLLAAWHLERGFEPPPPIDVPFESGGTSHRNVVPIYDLSGLEIVHYVLQDIPLRTSTLRSIGCYLNHFAIESFMDELAGLAGTDPVEFRLRHLSDARERAVIEAAAKKVGWGKRRATAPGGTARGIGIGFGRYKNNSAIAAVIAEVDVADSVRVLRFVAAVDCGRVVNPDGVANQIEGGVIQAASWTLKEQVRFDRTRITSRTWEDYPILCFSESPSVEVVLIDRPQEPSVGVGEVVAGQTAAAIANAVYDAIGVRVRDLPLTRERLVSIING